MRNGDRAARIAFSAPDGSRDCTIWVHLRDVIVDLPLNVAPDVGSFLHLFWPLQAPLETDWAADGDGPPAAVELVAVVILAPGPVGPAVFMKCNNSFV